MFMDLLVKRLIKIDPFIYSKVGTDFLPLGGTIQRFFAVFYLRVFGTEVYFVL